MTQPSQFPPVLAPSILWPSVDEMSEKVDSFYASPFGDGWDSYETSDLLDHIAWFAGTHDSVDIFAWVGSREQIPAIETRRTLAAIERAEPVFFTNMAPLFSDYMTFENADRSTIFEDSSESVTPHP